MTVDPRAELVAGVLAAEGGIRPGLTEHDVLRRLRLLLTRSTVWVPEIVGAGEFAFADYLSATGRPPAWWEPSAGPLVEANASALSAGWAVVEGLAGRPNYGDRPALRLQVSSTADALEARRLGAAAGFDVVGTVYERGSWRWRWPLRVAVVDSPNAAAQRTALQGAGLFAFLYDIRTVDPNDPAPIDVLVTDGLATVATTPGVVVVVGPEQPHDAEFATRLAAAERAFNCGALVVQPGPDLSWFEEAVRALSHDYPPDVAFGRVADPGTVIFGDPDFLTAATLRRWLDAAQVEFGQPRFRAVASEAHFDSESAGGFVGAHEVRIVEQETGRTVELTAPTRDHIDLYPYFPDPTADPILAGGGYPTGADGDFGAIPETADLPDRPDFPDLPNRPDLSVADRPDLPDLSDVVDRPDLPDLADIVDLPDAELDGDESGPLQPTPTPSPAPRRLRTQVQDAAGVVVRGFVRGRPHAVRLRIGAKDPGDAAPPEQQARTPFPVQTLTPVTLTVRMQASTAGGVQVRQRTLVLPPAGDTRWTRKAEFKPPADDASDFAVYISVLWDGRTVQSAILHGVLLDAEPNDDQLALDIDVSSGTDLAADHRKADVTLTVMPGPGDLPVLVDQRELRSVDSGTLSKTNDRVKARIAERLADPPPDLDGAAATLADLAYLGATFGQQLGVLEDERYAAASWVHISSFGPAMPLELVYTHKPPDEDATICPPARAGALACDAACPHRTDRKMVCPFGFWATSKILERQHHTTARRDESPAQQRVVQIRGSAAAGVTARANKVLPTAASDIYAAVQAFAGPGAYTETATWSALETLSARAQQQLIVLVTHTQENAAEAYNVDGGLELVLDVAEPLRRIDDRYISPAAVRPGPLVLALGCETALLSAGYAEFPTRLHAAGAEIVLTAFTPVPGKTVAAFVPHLFALLEEMLADRQPHRFGAALAAARRRMIATGDLLALALVGSGDGEVQIKG